MERYFISYSYVSRTGSGFGSTETVLSTKITDINVIIAIAKSIEEDYGLESGSVIILNFQRFDS